MSKREHVPLTQITEHEELKLEDKDVADTDGKRKKKNDSVKSNSSSPVSPLIRAVRRGSSSTSLFFQERNLDELDIKETDNFQRNVFHYAVSKPDALRKILEYFKDFEAKTSVLEALRHPDKDGETPIHLAAKIANIESLEILNEYDNSIIKLKTTIGKKSVLHLAVRSRSLAAVKYVLSEDPELVNCLDNMLQTPVHYAASLKQSSIMVHLISKGADTTISDANDQLAIHVSASKGIRNNVELLLQEDPDVVDVLDNSDQTPLLLAAKNGFRIVVSYLLAKNANYEQNDKHGFTAFDWAVYYKLPEVVRVFLEAKVWKEVITKSKYGPEGCLAKMIESIPEMARILLNRCVTTNGTKGQPDYEVIYDFFCLESRDENQNEKRGCPQFLALETMVENRSETCLRHPVALKYVDVKWRERGFKYSAASILITLVFHICLMIYTTRVIGVVSHKRAIRRYEYDEKSLLFPKRPGKPPNGSEMMALRVIMLTIIVGGLLKEVAQMFLQRFHYFVVSQHYYRLAVSISVMMFLLPVNKAITGRQIGGGAIAVLLSWLNLMQFLKVVPVLGTYIILVYKIFWTLMRVFLVVLVYLLSFASTFYVLLAENSSFRNLYISLVSTFVGMMADLDYDNLFVTVGSYPSVYELKMVVLVLFMLTMSIVVNNALIGLAVGDAEQVMKSAKFDKFLRRARFIIQLERSMNKIPWLRMKEDNSFTEFPEQERNLYQRLLNLLYSGSKIDEVDTGTDSEHEFEHELELNLEDHIEKAIETKLENLRLSLRNEFKEITDHITEGRKELEEKMEKILEKLK